MLKRGNIIHRNIKGIQIGGSTPRRVQAGGATPRGELPFAIDFKGGRDSHIDIIGMTIDVEKFLVYIFPSMISVDINVGISINAKGGNCSIMLSLMPMV